MRGGGRLAGLFVRADHCGRLDRKHFFFLVVGGGLFLSVENEFPMTA